MRSFILMVLASVVLASAVLLAQGPSAKELAPVAAKLSEAQELKKQLFLVRMENATLRARLADREARVQALETVFRQQIEQQFGKESKDLSDQCKALETEFREALKVAPDVPFDCNTLEFKR